MKKILGMLSGAGMAFIVVSLSFGLMWIGGCFAQLQWSEPDYIFWATYRAVLFVFVVLGWIFGYLATS